MATIFLAGDSTMQHNDYRTYPQVGWGQGLGLYLDPAHTLRNCARNGRSTRSFIAEGRLDWIADEISAEDFLFIQFAHNDEKREDPERYSPAFGEYQDNLRKFIAVAKDAGAYPVLLTSITRRHFAPDGVLEDGIFGDYPEAMAQVAREENVPLIDVFTASQKAIQALGPEKSKNLYMRLSPGEYPNYPKGSEDDTHLRFDGAELVASIVANALRELGAPYDTIPLTQENEDYHDRPFVRKA